MIPKNQEKNVFLIIRNVSMDVIKKDKGIKGGGYRLQSINKVSK